MENVSLIVFVLLESSLLVQIESKHWYRLLPTSFLPPPTVHPPPSSYLLPAPFLPPSSSLLLVLFILLFLKTSQFYMYTNSQSIAHADCYVSNSKGYAVIPPIPWEKALRNVVRGEGGVEGERT